MDQLELLTSTIALTMGVAWASGVNLYAAILMLGVLSSTGNIILPPKLELLSDPMIMSVAGVLFFVEFFADKIPGVDSGWDVIQTFVRIPAGAILAAGAVGDVNPALVICAALLGGGVAGATHATKASTRVLINTSPEPFSNWIASFSEDMLVVLGLWTALHHPLIFLALLVLFAALVVYLLPRLWRGVKKIFSLLSALFGRNKSVENSGEATASALPNASQTSGISSAEDTNSEIVRAGS